MAKKKKNRGSIDGFVYGAARLETAEEDLLFLLNLLLELGESYKNIVCAEGRASVELAYPSARRAQRLCADRGIAVSLELFYGIPHLLSRLIKRRGLIAGFFAAVLIVSIGCGVLWDIRIEGNELLSEREIKEILCEHGICPGARIEGLDIGALQADIARKSEGIAWISVNVIGTVAFVEVVEERLPPVKSPPEGDGINLVAARDGVISGFEIIAGEGAVGIGQTVRKGELLVSGLVDSLRSGYRAIESEGRIFARTEHSFELEIPYEYTLRKAERSEICEISIIFFSFRQKFFKNYGFSGSEYDKIYSDIYIYSSGGRTLPVGVAVVKAPIYTETVMTRTPADAVGLAYFELNRTISAELAEAEILSKAFEGSENAEGNAYRLTCRVTCIEDIAEEKEFHITP